MNSLGDIYGVSIKVSTLVAQDKAIILGVEHESGVSVPSEANDKFLLPMKTREIAVMDLKTGEIFGDEITYATEILTTKEGVAIITKYVDKQREDKPNGEE